MVILTEPLTMYIHIDDFHGLLSARNKDQKSVGHFLKTVYFRLLTAVPLKMYRKFGQPNAEIGWKMANGRLLFLALLTTFPLQK